MRLETFIDDVHAYLTSLGFNIYVTNGINYKVNSLIHLNDKQFYESIENGDLYYSKWQNTKYRWNELMDIYSSMDILLDEFINEINNTGESYNSWKNFIYFDNRIYPKIRSSTNVSIQEMLNTTDVAIMSVKDRTWSEITQSMMVPDFVKELPQNKMQFAKLHKELINYGYKKEDLDFLINRDKISQNLAILFIMKMDVDEQLSFVNKITQFVHWHPCFTLEREYRKSLEDQIS